MSEYADLRDAVAARAERATRHGHEVRVECPCCVSSKTNRADASLGVNLRTGWFGCFRCGFKGRLPGYGDGDVELPPEADVEAAPPEGYIALGCEPGASAEALEPARAYLRGRRGMRMDLVAELQIGACVGGFYAGRIVVPVLSPHSAEWCGWISRAWGLSDMPYRSMPGMRRGEMLYNEEALDAPGDCPVLVVEGVFDVIAHYPDAVAVFGKPTVWHMDRLRASQHPIVFVPDGDDWEAGWGRAMQLQVDGRRANYVRLPPKVDPNEIEPERLMGLALRALEEPL